MRPCIYGSRELKEALRAPVPRRFLAKMIMDQAIFPPLMITLTFTTLTVVEGLFAGIGLTISKGLFATGVKVKDVGTLFNDGISKV